MTRGVLYIVWGERAKSRVPSSIASLRQFHPDWPVHVHELGAECEGYRGLLEKSRMQDFSPFDETLYLDADTTVLGPLEFGFQQAERFGLACTICECPWARRYRNVRQRADAVEYSTAVMFWRRDKMQPLFDEWKRITPLVDTAIDFVRDGQLLRAPFGDQGSFCAVVEALGFNPFALPLNWNFRPQFHTSYFGPLKIWHDYAEPPPPFLDLNKKYESPAFLIDYHRVTWRQ